MNISPDQIVYFNWGSLQFNATIIFTWIVMLVLAVGSWLVTRRVTSESQISAWQNLIEIAVVSIRDQIKEVSSQRAERFIPFVGTIFLFILTANVLAIVPGYRPPTASFSTTLALALCVFFAVPYYGIADRGLSAYLQSYLKPSFIMLPFNIIGEITRTLSLAVRLYGNMMSGTVIIAILLGIVPLFFPVVMQALGLLIGVIQAYIFSILAMVYISSATKANIQKGAREIKAEGRE